MISKDWIKISAEQILEYLDLGNEFVPALEKIIINNYVFKQDILYQEVPTSRYLKFKSSYNEKILLIRVDKIMKIEETSEPNISRITTDDGYVNIVSHSIDCIMNCLKEMKDATDPS